MNMLKKMDMNTKLLQKMICSNAEIVEAKPHLL